MSVLTIKVNNLDAIRGAFKAAPAKMTVNLHRAIDRIVTRIEADTKKEAPVNKQGGGGNLRQSIRGYTTGIGRGVVEVTARYAGWVHDGTRPHIIRITNRRVLANRRTGQIFGTVVKHPGTRANPFLQRAIDKNRAFIDKEFGDAVANSLK